MDLRAGQPDKPNAPQVNATVSTARRSSAWQKPFMPCTVAPGADLVQVTDAVAQMHRQHRVGERARTSARSGSLWFPQEFSADFLAAPAGISTELAMFVLF